MLIWKSWRCLFGGSETWEQFFDTKTPLKDPTKLLDHENTIIFLRWTTQCSLDQRLKMLVLLQQHLQWCDGPLKCPSHSVTKNQARRNEEFAGNYCTQETVTFSYSSVANTNLHTCIINQNHEKGRKYTRFLIEKKWVTPLTLLCHCQHLEFPPFEVKRFEFALVNTWSYCSSGTAKQIIWL